MKFLFDLFPIILFFLAFKFYPDWATEPTCISGMCIPGGTEGAIYAATVVAIIASIIQVAIYWFQHRRFEKMHLVTLAMIVLLGGATLAFQDKTFIMWKPTVVNWIFAAAFLGSQFIGDKPLIMRMIGDNITLDSPKTWQQLNYLWIGFFVAVGIINLIVAYNFSEDTWVNFKLFGFLGLTIVFVIVQSIYLAQHIVETEEELPAKSQE